MKTEFYKLLENETEPHLIFAHVHRRKNELEIALRKLNCEIDIKKATDEEFLDLATISLFFDRLCDFALPRLSNFGIEILEARRRKLSDESDEFRGLGSMLAYRAMGFSGRAGVVPHYEYMQIIEPTDKKLRYLRASESKEADEAMFGRLAAEDEKLAAEKAAMLAA